jgi:putative hydrolase of the HAD superfamily
MPISLVAFDGDDTLWKHGHVFPDGQKRIAQIMAKYVDEPLWAVESLRAETENLIHFGYGVKSFTLSIIDTAIRVTDARISTRDISTIIDLAKSMMSHEVEVIAATRASLKYLKSKYRLLLITKGDHIEQWQKIEKAQIAHLFDEIEIVHNKNENVYKSILRSHDVLARDFVMIGDSIKSDIVPVINIGGWAIHIPNDLVWEHEKTQIPVGHDRYVLVDSIESAAKALDVINQKTDL